MRRLMFATTALVLTAGLAAPSHGQQGEQPRQPAMQSNDAQPDAAGTQGGAGQAQTGQAQTGGTAADQGATVVDQERTQVIVKQPPPTIIVKQPPPQITVQQGQPKVIVEQEQPVVRVEQTPPAVQVEQGQPQVRVEQTPPGETGGGQVTESEARSSTGQQQDRPSGGQQSSGQQSSGQPSGQQSSGQEPSGQQSSGQEPSGQESPGASGSDRSDMGISGTTGAYSEDTPPRDVGSTILALPPVVDGAQSGQGQQSGQITQPTGAASAEPRGDQPAVDTSRSERSQMGGAQTGGAQTGGATSATEPQPGTAASSAASVRRPAADPATSPEAAASQPGTDERPAGQQGTAAAESQGDVDRPDPNMPAASATSAVGQDQEGAEAVAPQQPGDAPVTASSNDTGQDADISDSQTQPVQPALQAGDAVAYLERDVISNQGEELGEIENFVVDQTGEVKAVVIAWGGFLGIGRNKAAVPAEQVDLEGNTGRSVIELSSAEIRELPEFDDDSDNVARQFGAGARLLEE